ncbi:small-conductance mechanosensitive channel [Desulfosporosinus orientis DSM 765]|uniref:Mechanosensing system component YbdG n=1 Tax=Desulfosporosinus orientis (strain ATCC 19365 / DSM 765 / NCIMB 8382 / VKM B-1628 / Singapore I) TaxID=768706 RepID=G7WAT1_DESOD|nr:mechanosensitive ion channel family protein [Desulfosporosinus orientis]AET67142.1 small-conductance mechanosensitive channel [Desulfosporosinus orientis DSM 765]
MVQLMTNWFQNYGVNVIAARYIAVGILLVFIALLSVVAYFISRKIVLRFLSLVIKNNKLQWDDVMLERKVFHKLCNIVPAIIFYVFSTAFPGQMAVIIENLSSAYIILAGVLVLDALLNSVDDIYRTYEIAKHKPIKGYLQVAKIIIYIIGGILIIAAVIGQSSLWRLLSGIGALTAVLLLVFKDSLLGLVAGIQLSSNDMIRIGDWIEMSKYGANGDVIDISLNTVKVENFDKTITTIPTYALVSDSFINWRGMEQSGGRRINRSIYIDATSVTFCTDEMLDKFEKIHYLSDYIKQKKAEIALYNQEHNIDSTQSVNGRRLTNLGTFRAYIQCYLKNHPQIHKRMIQMVRQLPPGESGIPLDIYVFTNQTEWAIYESIQSDIFDHLFAVVPEFGLRVFQKPTGYDISQPLKDLKDCQESIKKL